MPLANPFRNVLSEPAEPKPESATCGCGETLEPFALFGKWRIPEACEACHEIEIIRQRIKQAPPYRPLFSVPTLFASATEDGYECPPGDARARQAVAEWSPMDGRGLYLFGERGHGKSHLAYALARRLIDVRAKADDPASWSRGVEPRLVPAVAERMRRLYPDGIPCRGWRVEAGSVSSILAHMRKQYSEGRGADGIVDRLILADVLILDDLGTEKVTDWSREQLFLIINGRYEDCRPTVITSNYAPGHVGARFSGRDDDEVPGQRLASRLIDMCRVVNVGAQGDYRITRARAQG